LTEGRLGVARLVGGGSDDWLRASGGGPHNRGSGGTEPVDAHCTDKREQVVYPEWGALGIVDLALALEGVQKAPVPLPTSPAFWPAFPAETVRQMLGHPPPEVERVVVALAAPAAVDVRSSGRAGSPKVGASTDLGP
jgi:hypothetical protein